MTLLDGGRWLCGVLVLGVLAGCGEDEVRVRSYEDEGRACVQSGAEDASAGEGQVSAGEDAVARVVLDACASFCAEVEVAECEATVEGDTIRITSRARTREEIDPNSSCPSACLEVAATCSVGPLDAGTYAIEHGEATQTLEVPGPSVCAEAE